jgi:general secretion pathway protein D
VSTRQRAIGILVVAALFTGGCAAGRAFRQAQAATRAGDPDQAVAYYRKAVQAAPDNTSYKIALERAMLDASRAHLDKAKDFEQHDQLDAALSEYRLAAEYDPSNRLAAAQAAALEQTIRNRVEASRPTPPLEKARERADQALSEPILNPASREPLVVRFNNTNLRDVLSAIGGMTGINIVYDREVADRPITLDLNGVTLEEALDQIMTTNQLSYKVQSERSILVFPDTTQKHAQYDEQVIRTFYIQHADATELVQLLSVIVRLPSLSVVPAIAVNKTNNSITVRGTAPVVQIIQKVIEQNDKPRAEVVFDVEILEVDSNRAKQYGLNLSEYAIGSIFSPETVPPSGTTTGTGATAAGTSTQPDQVRPPSPFNLNTISRGVTTSDFYLAVPTAVVRFLESDSHTKLIAKPQLRGAEGTKLTLNLGQEIPIVTTSYTPIASGGGAVNPLNSYQYKPVGINLDITPRVTLDGDVLIDLDVESNSVGSDINVAGTSYPSFGERKVSTRLRLHDGEANLLAGLFRQDEQSTVNGFPGAVHVPGLRQLFSGTNETSSQTDIVRTSGVTADDLMPIYIGSQQNLGVGGAPPTIVSPGTPEQPAILPGNEPPAAGQPQASPAPILPTPQATPGAAPTPAPPAVNGTIQLPPGSSPVPGTVVVPPPAAAAPTQAPPPAAPQAASPAVAPVSPPPSAPPATALPTAAPAIGSATVQLSAPPVFARGGGPYTVPITISNVARLSTITLTVVFDPALLSVRSVQEGSFMRSGGGPEVTFVHQVSGGRLDITLTRAADATGATGSGLLAAIQFDAISVGTTTLSVSGSATGPGGTVMGLQFRPATVTVQ